MNDLPININGYNSYYVLPAYKNVAGDLEQLIQLLRITSDGDLVSKISRDRLVDKGLAFRSEGFNVISTKGIQYLRDLNVIAH